MNRTQLLPAAALLALLSACAPAGTGGTPAPGGDATGQVLITSDALHVSTGSVQRVLSREVDAPVARVWEALPGVLGEMGFAVQADAASRTVSTQPRTAARRFLDEPAARFFDCGRGQFGAELAATASIRFVLRATVQPAGGEGSRLDTVVEAHARTGDGTSALMAQCRSTGRLEDAIAAAVRARVAS
jgi:hypothetical protein